MHAIEVKKVTKIYRKGFRAIRIPAVVDCSFTVGSERITGFVGPNGAGKTTTIKMLNGLVFPTSGELLIHGKNAAEPHARSGVAYLSEQPYFYKHLSVGEMLRFTAQLIGIPRADIPGKTERVLRRVELTHKTRAKIKELSKGLQQRLNMAQALLGRPHTLILDEPMSGMDPPGRRLFREIMKELREQKCTLFFSTHVLDDVESVCDDVIVLQQGKLTYAGTVESLLAEGNLGTEIRVAELSEPCEAAVGKAGGTVENQPESGERTIFVKDAALLPGIQKILYEQQAYPHSIRQRTMTLEELLYRREERTETV